MYVLSIITRIGKQAIATSSMIGVPIRLRGGGGGGLTASFSFGPIGNPTPPGLWSTELHTNRLLSVRRCPR